MALCQITGAYITQSSPPDNVSENHQVWFKIFKVSLFWTEQKFMLRTALVPNKWANVWPYKGPKAQKKKAVVLGSSKQELYHAIPTSFQWEISWIYRDTDTPTGFWGSASRFQVHITHDESAREGPEPHKPCRNLFYTSLMKNRHDFPHISLSFTQ